MWMVFVSRSHTKPIYMKMVLNRKCFKGDQGQPSSVAMSHMSCSVYVYVHGPDSEGVVGKQKNMKSSTHLIRPSIFLNWKMNVMTFATCPKRPGELLTPKEEL
jgi:hypothetical protein